MASGCVVIAPWVLSILLISAAFRNRLFKKNDLGKSIAANLNKFEVF